MTRFKKEMKKKGWKFSEDVDCNGEKAYILKAQTFLQSDSLSVEMVKLKGMNGYEILCYY